MLSTEIKIKLHILQAKIEVVLLRHATNSLTALYAQLDTRVLEACLNVYKRYSKIKINVKKNRFFGQYIHSSNGKNGSEKRRCIFIAYNLHLLDSILF